MAACLVILNLTEYSVRRLISSVARTQAFLVLARMQQVFKRPSLLMRYCPPLLEQQPQPPLRHPQPRSLPVRPRPVDMPLGHYSGV
jgi:hypothetical protein